MSKGATPIHGTPSQRAFRERTPSLAGRTRPTGGPGKIPVKLFDALVKVVWSADDHGPLDEIRRDYLASPGSEGRGGGQLPAQRPGGSRTNAVSPREFALPGTDAPIKVGWELKRKGDWTVPTYSKYETKGGILKLDFRHARFESDTVTVHIDGSWMADIQITTLPDFGLVDRTTHTWGSDANLVEPRRPATKQPTIILEGTIAGSTLKIKVKPPKNDSFWGSVEDWVGN